MDWQEFIRTLGYFGISATAISLLLAYLARTFTEQQLKKDIEIFKSDLLKEADKAKLQYSILQTKRAEVIREFYERLIELEEAGRALMSPIQSANGPPENDRGNLAINKHSDFRYFYLKNRIFFDKNTCGITDKILDTFWLALIDFQYKDVGSRERTAVWAKSWDTISKEIPKLREELEELFRDIIGIK